MTVLSFFITSKDLNSIETNLSRFFSCVENDSSAVGVVEVTLIGGSGNLVKIRSEKRGFVSRKPNFCLPRGAQSCVHIGNLSLEKLELSNRLSKLFSLVCVWNGNIASGLHETDRAAGEHQSLEVQARHENIGTLSNASKNIVLVHSYVFKDKLASGAEIMFPKITKEFLTFRAYQACQVAERRRILQRYRRR